MKSKALSALFVFLPLVVAEVRAAEPEPVTRLPIFNILPIQDVGDKTPKKPGPEKKPADKKLTQPPLTDAFAQSNLPVNNLGSGFNPNMMGDFPGLFARRSFTVFGTLTTTTSITTTTVQKAGTVVQNTVTTTTTTPTSTTRVIVVPVSSAGAFKIAENASPRPQDRVFVTGNYFSSLRGPDTGANEPLTITNVATSSVPGVVDAATTSSAFFPGTPRTTATLYRQTYGFEKTFLGGDASIEMRVPMAQLFSTAPGFGGQNVGDMTFIGKYAVLNDRTTGNVISGGLAVTAPTGPRIETIQGNIHPTLLQPWGGYIWNADRFFLQAFHSAVIPTDSRGTIFVFNDVAVNYWLYRGDASRFLSYVVPMAEAHVTTPVNHRDDSAPILIPDLVVMTGGVHLGFFRNTSLSLGVATPVSGPRLFGVECFVQFNVRR